MAVSVVKGSGFVQAVLEDLKFKKLQKMRESGTYASLDPEALLTELRSLHAVKRVRGLKADRLLMGDSRMALLEVILENQAYRSRTVEIKVECIRVSRMLEDHIEAATRYLSTKYAAQLAREFSTAKARTEAVAHVLNDFIGLKNRLDTVIRISDEIIKDHDQAYWSVKLVADLIQTSAKRPEV